MIMSTSGYDAALYPRALFSKRVATQAAEAAVPALDKSESLCRSQGTICCALSRIVRSSALQTCRVYIASGVNQITKPDLWLF